MTVATAYADDTAQPISASAAVGTTWELALQRAQEHIRYGLTLGSRRAICSAQSEFIQALELITRELDAASGGHPHEDALASGLRALDALESVDMQSRTSASPKPGAKINATAFQAMQQQLFDAQERLAFAGGHEPTASMALYALGRSYISLAEQVPEESALCGAKALTLYQAAIEVDAANSLASNELSILLARCGELEEAAQVLMQGLSVAPQPQMWRNLAILHQKLGNTALAQEDLRRCEALAQSMQGKSDVLPASGLASVQWVEPADFVRCSGSDAFGEPSGPVGTPSSQRQKVAEEPPKSNPSKSLLPSWLVAEFGKANGEKESGQKR